jgi:glycosyltransferase involved in cell wall biosynthesis
MEPNKGIFKKRIGNYDQARFKNEDGGGLTLDLPPLKEELPCVSVVTITKDRALFAAVAVHNWNNFVYPPEKLEWVIVDDSQDPNENFEQYLPDDDRINYIKLEKWMPVAEKRNYAIQQTKYEFIVHMDDDDYYFPDSLYAKIRILLHYNKEGVHSMPVGAYDMMEQTSCILAYTSNDPNRPYGNDVAEATLAFRKRYWRNNKFKSLSKDGISEGRAFINSKFNAWINVHFLFNTISITHAKNATLNNRRIFNENKDIQVGDFKSVFPEGFNYILDNIRTIILNKGGYERKIEEAKKM